MILSEKIFKIYVIWSASDTEHITDEFDAENTEEAEKFIRELMEKEKKDKDCKLEKIIYGREMNIVLSIK